MSSQKTKPAPDPDSLKWSETADSNGDINTLYGFQQQEA